MKKLLALAAVVFFAAMMMASARDNCVASATGTFTFSVEEAIGLTAIGDVEIDLGDICPGCTKTFGDCIGWQVTGGETCLFHAAVTDPTNLPETFTLDDQWMVSDDGGQEYENFPTESHPGDNFAIQTDGANVFFKICVNSIGVPCTASARDWTLRYTLDVNYICSLEQGEVIE